MKWSVMLRAVVLFVFAMQFARGAQDPPAGARVKPENSKLSLGDVYFGPAQRDGLKAELVFYNVDVSLEQVELYLSMEPPVPGLKIQGVEDSWRCGFYITGRWQPKQSYKVHINPGLIDNNGARLANRLTKSFKTPPMLPYCGFDQQGQFYFPCKERSFTTPLAVETRGWTEARFILYRMFPNNVTLAINRIGSDGDPSYNFKDDLCEEIDQWTMKLKNDPLAVIQTEVDLSAHLPKDLRGVYCLVVQGVNKDGQAGQNDDEYDYYYRCYPPKERDHKLIVASRLGCVTHWQDDQLRAFVTDLYTLKPVRGLQVQVYSSKNQLLDTQRTDGDGLAVFDDFKKNLGRPVVLVAEDKDDFTFLELEPNKDDQSLVNSSLPLFSPEDYDAYLYADRNLYRPGEPVHLRWIVRTHYKDAVSSVPLLMTITKPNGQELVRQPLVLSELGTGGYDLETQKAHPTGQYSVTLALPGKNPRPIGRYQFSLEEFVPNRIEVNVTPEPQPWLPGQTYTASLECHHLFGAPAAGLKAQLEVSLSPAHFEPEGFKGYRFSNDSEPRLDSLRGGEQTTSADGRAEFQMTWKPGPEVSFPVHGTMTGRVFEAGGRSVSGQTGLTLFPAGACLGVTLSSDPAGETAAVGVAALNPDGTPADLKSVQVTLEKEEWSYYIRRYYGRYAPNTSAAYCKIKTVEVPLKEGLGCVSLPVNGWGSYRVRVHEASTPQYSTVNFYRYWGSIQITQSARPSMVRISLDKEFYEVGQTAQICIEAPFDGRAMVVIQGENFKDAMAVDLKDKTALVRYTIKPGDVPWLWVEATVVHSITQQPQKVSPFCSFGAASMMVKDPSASLDVSLPSLPAEVRPDSSACFEVLVRDSKGNPAAQAELTLAVVDEGIHAITHYRSPDPLSWFERLRRPDLRRAHYYDRLAHDFTEPEPGGDGPEEAKRLGNPGENWIKPVALWSGTVTTGADGRAVIPMNIPEFNGQLRLVAVACTAHACGRAEQKLLVRRPYMLQTSQPRFLLPGDRFSALATLFNTTDQPCSATLECLTSGTLTGLPAHFSLDLNAKSEATVTVDLATSQTLVGPGSIVWEAIFSRGGAELERVKTRLAMPVNAPTAFTTEHRMLLLEPGQSMTFKNDVYQPNALMGMRLTVGSNALLQLSSGLNWVVRYPYGCVEQTTSRLLPLYLLAQSGGNMEGYLECSRSRLEEYITAGIDRLFSMQTSSGGLAYWPGGVEPNNYGSVYALHALTLIKNGRRFPIDDRAFSALQDYVQQLLGMPVNLDYSTKFLRAYAVYVLTLGGKIQTVQQVECFDKTPMPSSARYLLAAALARATGDMKRVQEYLKTAPKEEWESDEYDGTLNSSVRSTAIELIAMCQTQPADSVLLEQRAQALLAYLQQPHWFWTTQQTSFVITALCDYYKLLNISSQTAGATLTDQTGRQFFVKGIQPQVFRADGPGGCLKLNNTGECKLFVTLDLSGLPLTVTTGSLEQGLTVVRTFYNTQGERLTSPTTVRQTDNVIVELDLYTSLAVVKNVIVSALLPAGLEIENPRLSLDSIPMASFSGNAYPSFQDVRDDRLIIAFDQLSSKHTRFYFLARAVTPGQFSLPGVRAECMYNPSIMGQSEAGSLMVVPLNTSTVAGGDGH